MTRQFRANGTFRWHDPNQDIEWARGSGSWLWDNDGNRFLDCVSGYSANVLGHCHPDLVSALTDQASKLSFTTGGESALRKELEEALCHLVVRSQQRCGFRSATGSAPKAWVSTTGARAVEIAWRVAFHRRPGGLVTFDLGYHGRSIATSYVSDTTQQNCLMAGSSVPIRFEIPFPRVAPKSQTSLQEACDESLEIFRRALHQHADRMSALLVEPAIGSRGYYFAPADYFQKLVSLAREHDLLILSDEVQMGLGRLGGMIASHMQGWNPDLLILGKALGGGMLPISCVIGCSSILDRLPPGLESETFAGSPIACRLAIEVLRLLDSSDDISHSSRLHEALRQSLASRLPSDAVIGLGSATAIDLRSGMANALVQSTSKSRNAVDEFGTRAAYRWASLLRENGILVHVTGSLRDRIAIIPPLNIGSSEMRIVEEACLLLWPQVLEDTFRDAL